MRPAQRGRNCYPSLRPSQFVLPVAAMPDFVVLLSVPGLREKDLAAMPLHLPSIEEQRRIAGVLNACDQEIRLLKAKLELLKKQRKGLMQKLLTGEIRVKEAAA